MLNMQITMEAGQVEWKAQDENKWLPIISTTHNEEILYWFLIR